MHSKIGLPLASDTRYIGAQQKDDLSILAVVAYNTWLEDSVFMHVAVERNAHFRFLLREAFTYAFVTCEKKRVYGLTPITSEKALLLAKRLGFKQLSWTQDFVLQVMEKADCRWIKHDSTDSAGRDVPSSLPGSAGIDYSAGLRPSVN
jgi:hypothetical protein